MDYETSKEALGEVEIILDGENDVNYISKPAELLSRLSGIPPKKLEYHIQKFGLIKILEEPGIMGISPEQEDMMKAIEYLIKGDFTDDKSI